MEKWIIPVGVVLLICVCEWMREILTFRTTHYQISTPKLRGLDREYRVVFLSDLHNKCYGKKNRKLLKAIRDAKPDFILIGGDMVVGKAQVSQKNAEDFVTQLPTICPAYYANGNHEFRMKINTEKYGDIYASYRSRLERSGVIFLENEFMDLNLDRFSVRIYGLEIPREGYKKFPRNDQITLKQINERIGLCDCENYNILLAHNPIYMAMYRKWGADLILSGHIHGGLIRLPFIGGVISPQFIFFPKYSGEYKKEGNTSIVVSKGLGTHTINLRFLNQPEMIVLHIKGEDK